VKVSLDTDTCVISELRHPKGNPRVRRAVDALKEEGLFISALIAADRLAAISHWLLIVPGACQSPPLS
jgi:hypothetical protein